MRPFRFGYQFRDPQPDELRVAARQAEAAGFDVISSWDHVAASWTPLLPLLAVAEATTKLRVCPLVINNDFHHPVHLAGAIADLDVLTDGRVELGIGAGHAFTEYAALGQPFDPPVLRKQRLIEAVGLLRRLFDGEEITVAGDQYQLAGARIRPSRQAHLPILVGVNGRDALAGAVPIADTIGLTMLGRTLSDGQRHEVRWQPARLDATISHIRRQPNGAAIELNALVQAVRITDDRVDAAHELADAVDGLTVEDALETPFLAIGTADEIAEHFVRCRARWGISYLTVRDIDAFQPVIERLRSHDTGRR